MQMGIIGLPNVGKSSLFNALTKAGAQASNYPFTTVEPNVGIALMMDSRLDRLKQLFQPEKVVPGAVRFVDIAGLVKGASQGEGLGNKFLSHIREVDALMHVLRCFKDDNVTHVMGGPDPKRDLDVIHTELLLADLEQASRAKDRFKGTAKTGDKASQEKLADLEKVCKGLEDGRWVNQVPGVGPSIETYQFLTSKKAVYVANVPEEDLKIPVSEVEKKYDLLSRMPEGPLVPVSIALESEMSLLDEAEAEAFRKDMGVKESALARVVHESMRALKLSTFFTAGPKEIRAWIFPSGSKAPQAAGKIHSDMEKGFIRADVYSFADLDALGSVQALQQAGKLRSEGKEYTVQDGDVLEIRFSA